MKITFVGAAHEVTGSCTLLELAREKYLIDRGMEQGMDVYENIPLPVAAKDVSAVFLTHAHIDHADFCRSFIKTASAGKFTRHLPHAVWQTSCCATRRTFRNPKPRGKHARQSARASRRSSRCTPLTNAKGAGIVLPPLPVRRVRDDRGWIACALFRYWPPAGLGLHRILAAGGRH